MALDYARFQALATRLISENGRAFSLVPPVAPADPAQPWGAQEAADPIEVMGVFLDLTKADDATPSSVERSTQTVFVETTSELPFECGAGWSLTDGSARYELTACAPLKPGAVLILYVLTVKA